MTRSMVVKGAHIPDNCGVAPYSFVNKQFSKKNSLIAGIPAKVIKEDFYWDIRSYREYMLNYDNDNLH